MRRFIILVVIAAIIAASVYGYLYYGVVAFYETNKPKITNLYIVQKPYRDTSFFFNHIDQDQTEKEIRRLKQLNQEIPWDLDYQWVVEHSIYEFTMDNRSESEKALDQDK